MALLDNWENACRLCSEEKNEMLSIFGKEGMHRKVVQKLRACLPVLVYKTDPLPKQICQFCAARLDDAFEFREHCLSVYKSMHQKLSSSKGIESVQIFLDAMKNSPDPCQAQLSAEKTRAPPPLVPLPASLPLETPLTPVESNSENRSNSCIDTLTELPCEVEIKEVNAEAILGRNTVLYESQSNKERINQAQKVKAINDNADALESNNHKAKDTKIGTEVQKEEKRTSILEQVLTGNLTMSDRKDGTGKAKLTSKWWCAPCNSYYKTREILMKHMQSECPRKYTCKKCCVVFESVEQLAKHEATDHLKVAVDFDISVNDCHQCDRQFVSWDMLKQHRLRDHTGRSNEIGTNTWCSLCNRFFSTMESYQSHTQLHQITKVPDIGMIAANNEGMIENLPKVEEVPKESKKEYLSENSKSLTCPTCGKVCTQQSALSNHMRTHEPKRHKCDICGRSFGLFIRLAAHRMSEHGQQGGVTPVMASVEQEEALNAEREAREAREARSRLVRSRTFSEMLGRESTGNNNEPPAKRNATVQGDALKNVARCGICLQWFNDHSTMLSHLQTHSENYSCKNFTCQICKKSFKERWQLLRHEVVHKRNEIVCGKSYSDKSKYRKHQKSHTMEKSSFAYDCSKCGRAFPKEVSLLTHECVLAESFGKKRLTSKSSHHSSATGSGKKYRCSKCSASFNSVQARNSHMKVHSEVVHPGLEEGVEKKMEAEDAPMPTLSPESSPAQFSRGTIEPKVEEESEESPPAPVKRTLIRTGGGYRCGVCQSPFVLREMAVAHLRSAHPVMPYQCPYCKKRFTTQYTFTHHIKTDHPKEPEN